MKTIDRVMAAYRQVYQLTDDQAKIVHDELVKFITELQSERLPRPPKWD